MTFFSSGNISVRAAASRTLSRSVQPRIHILVAAVGSPRHRSVVQIMVTSVALDVAGMGNEFVGYILYNFLVSFVEGQLQLVQILSSFAPLLE